VHAHWTYEFALAALGSKVRTLVTAHDAPLTILRYQPTAYRLMRTWMAWRVTRLARFMTSVSEHVATQFIHQLGFCGDMRIVANALPDEVFSSVRAETRCRPGGRATFATVLTGWSGYKNGAVVLRAFCKLRTKLPESRLVMFGPDYGPHEFAQRWAMQRQLDRGVDFVGSLSYSELIRRIGSEVDLLVHPAREESFGMPVAEAMALGVPVVAAGGCRGVAWLLDNGKLGFLVKGYRPTDWADAMLRVHADGERRRPIVEQARTSAAMRFRAAVVADAYDAAYERVVGEN
jgi:L-malate glycosyltransferase